MNAEWERYADLDRRLVEAAKGIKILSSLDWPARLCEEFLDGWQAGRPRLPEG